MEPLIVLSHGSRHPRAAEGIAELVAAAKAELGDVPVVEAHLDFSADTLAVVAGRLAACGYTRAVVVPLLFSSGYHARHDVPTEIAHAARESCIELVLAGSLGAGADIARLVIDRARRDNPIADELIIYPVGSSTAAAQADYAELADLTDQLRAVGEGWVTTHPATGAHHPLDELPTTNAHVVPLFVTHGLLLDKAHHHLPPHTTISGPLGGDLAGVVATRYRQAVPA